MEELKSLFAESSLSYEEFEQKLGEAGDTIKLANLKSGGYVDKARFDKSEKSVNDWKTKYSALEESTKDYAELKSSYDTLKADYETLQKKQEEADKISLISGANVNPKFAKFVMTEVSSLTNENKDFKTALEEYLKDNKEFINVNRGTHIDLESGKGQQMSNNDIMNKMIRKR